MLSVTIGIPRRTRYSSMTLLLFFTIIFFTMYADDSTIFHGARSENTQNETNAIPYNLH